MTALLEVKDVSIRFGGVVAADGISLAVQQSEQLAIIGPNGAGKTTFLNICTGYLSPNGGEVYFEGRDITRMAPRKITKLGIARAFQIPQLFLEQTVIENLLLAITSRRNGWSSLRLSVIPLGATRPSTSSCSLASPITLCAALTNCLRAHANSSTSQSRLP